MARIELEHAGKGSARQPEAEPPAAAAHHRPGELTLGVSLLLPIAHGLAGRAGGLLAGLLGLYLRSPGMRQDGSRPTRKPARQGSWLLRSCRRDRYDPEPRPTPAPRTRELERRWTVSSPRPPKLHRFWFMMASPSEGPGVRRCDWRDRHAPDICTRAQGDGRAIHQLVNPWTGSTGRPSGSLHFATPEETLRKLDETTRCRPLLEPLPSTSPVPLLEPTATGTSDASPAVCRGQQAIGWKEDGGCRLTAPQPRPPSRSRRRPSSTPRPRGAVGWLGLLTPSRTARRGSAGSRRRCASSCGPRPAGPRSCWRLPWPLWPGRTSTHRPTRGLGGPSCRSGWEIRASSCRCASG